MNERPEHQITTTTPVPAGAPREDGARAIPLADEREPVRRQPDARRKLLWNAASILLTADEPDALLDELYEMLRVPLGLDLYVWYAFDDHAGALKLVSFAGLPEGSTSTIVRLDVSSDADPSVVAADLVEQASSILTGAGARSCSCHPLIAGSRLVGVLGFASRTREDFEPDDIEVMHAMSHQVTIAHQCLRVVSNLRDQDGRKDEFLATLSHELRTPLSAMRNGLQLLRLSNNDPAMLLHARSILDRQVQQMVRLVDDLLDVSRINSNRLELRKEWVELATVIKNAVETSRPAIEAAHHELTVTLPALPVLLDADPVRLAQALSNLLNNAAKYTEAGGRISLSAEQEGDRVVISVRDSGIGIPAETLPHVFRMFVQARQSVARSQGGLGIGLSVVRRLVEMHGGSVEARSEGTGKGSEFIIRLPVLVLLEE
jgi:signal transduction histidine kinase